MSSDPICRDFIKGALKMYVLHRASSAKVYGSALAKDLDAVGYRVSPGTLYPLLRELEEAGLLRSNAKEVCGRLRKYYELTTRGRTCLADARSQLSPLVREVVLEQPSGPGLPEEGESPPGSNRRAASGGKGAPR